MPICTRAGLDKKAEPVENFTDNEKVFFCELTKEIFRDYEDYFQRVMLLNSTIWACSETNKQNLTYAEALKCERKARKTGENMGEWLKAPALLLVEKQKQTSPRILLMKIFTFIKDRFFKGEEVLATKTKHNYVPCKVIQIITPKETLPGGAYDPKTVKYKVQKLSNSSDTWVTTMSQARRRRNTVSFEILKNFLKENTIIGENAIVARPDAYEKYVTSKNVTFETFYVGAMPQWEPGKKLAKGLVQASMGNYIVHDAEKKQRELDNLKEAMERMRREKEEKQAEQERKRAEMMTKIDEEVSNILRKTDDLERIDQRVMPVYKPVKTIVASKYFSEFLMIQEFLHSFTPILSASDVFRKSITFQQMCRAFLCREVAGPLSEILQVLLSTIFVLQIEENNDCNIKYAKSKKDGYLWKIANNALDAHLYVNRFLAAKMFELPIDAQTLTEILRLHLLSSGAPNEEKSEAYRYQYRNGYSVTEDPGLLLRINSPHILRALKMYTIYQLPFKDILKVLNCLVEQVLTYNSAICLIEERTENIVKTRFKARMFIARENKRIAQMLSTKKAIIAEHQAKLAENKEDTESERIMNKKLKDLEDQDRRERGNFVYELNRMNAEIFDYMTLLGTDRAYRNYYVFESLPGLFIEHPTEDEAIPCLDEPPKNDEELVGVTKERYKLKTFLIQRYKQSDKENLKKPSVAPTSIAVNGEVVKVNGTFNNAPNEPPKDPLAPTDLYMCSGDPKNCIVHDPKNPSRNKWAYINKEEELEALIASLNTFGIRESALKETLVKMKDNILPHILKCPEQILQVDITEREERISQMFAETQKKYANSNFGFSTNADINEVMLSTLTQQILDFEREITDGNLGKLKLPNLEKWREDISQNQFKSQVKILNYGPDKVNGNGSEKFEDPGNELGDTLDIESEDSGDEAVCVLESPSLQQNVSNLASALLQIEQCIEQKFLKEPFGVKNELKDKAEMDAKMATGRSKLQQWEVSLMNSSSYSQIFLHLNLLSDAVKWNKSSMQSSCLVCKRKGDADKLLLCDECNAGTHMFCMKPPMKEIPKGNWYCFRCELKLGLNQLKEKPKKKAKKIFSMEEDEDEKKAVEEFESDEDFKPYRREGQKKPNPRGGRRKILKDESEEEPEEEEDEEENDEEDVEEAEENVEEDAESNASTDNEPLRPANKTSRNSKKQPPKSNEEDNLPIKIKHDVKKDEKKKPSTSKKNNAKKVNNGSEDESEDSEISDEDDKPLKTNGNLKKKQEVKTKGKQNNEENEIEDLSESDMDEDVCKICNTDETDISCNGCKECYHLECTGMRRMPRGNWMCSTCKPQENQKYQNDSDSNSSNAEDDVPVAKKRRQITKNRKKSSSNEKLHQKRNTKDSDSPSSNDDDDDVPLARQCKQTNQQRNSSALNDEHGKKRKTIDSDPLSSNDEDDDVPLAKKRRQSNQNKNQKSASNEELNKNNNNSRRVRRTDEFLKLDTIALYDLLDQIMKHEDAWPFLRPVTQSEVPDYHKIIKNPMDFARIKSNLNMCRYNTNEEVISDIQLVFSNCDAYNSQGNEIYRAGASLERFVAEKCKEFNFQFIPSDMIIEQAQC